MEFTWEERMVAGIVHQALKDTKSKNESIRNDAMAFFTSGACERLTGIDGQTMLDLYAKYGTVKGEFSYLGDE